MAALDPQTIYEGIYAAVDADDTLTDVTSLIGDPPRIYTRTPADVTFPFIEVNVIPTTPLTGTRTGPGIKWIRRIVVQFNIWSQKSTLEEVNNIFTALVDVMDGLPTNAASVAKITAGGRKGLITHSIPGIERSGDFDMDTGSAFAICEYTLWFEKTA